MDTESCKSCRDNHEHSEKFKDMIGCGMEAIKVELWTEREYQSHRRGALEHRMSWRSEKRGDQSQEHPRPVKQSHSQSQSQRRHRTQSNEFRGKY